MDFQWWLYFALPMLAIIVRVRYLSRRPDLIVKDTVIYSFVIWTPSIISAVMFIFPEPFVDYFRTKYVCHNQNMLDILYYMIPKIPWRCSHFLEFDILDKYDLGIIILFDFFIAICFIIVLIFIYILDKHPRNYERVKDTKMSLMMKMPLYEMPVLFLAVSVIPFIYPLPIYSIEESPIALSRGYGAGPFFQATLTSFGAYLMARAITMSRLRR